MVSRLCSTSAIYIVGILYCIKRIGLGWVFVSVVYSLAMELAAFVFIAVVTTGAESTATLDVGSYAVSSFSVFFMANCLA